MIFTKKLSVLTAVMILSIAVFAQKSKKTNAVIWDGKRSNNWDAKRLSLGLQTGYTGFHGDIEANYYGSLFANKFSPPIGLIGKYALSHTLSLRGAFYAGLLDAKSELNGKQGFLFQNHFRTLELQPVFNLGNISFLRDDRKMHLYFFTGVGTFQNRISSASVNPSKPDEIIYKKWNITVPAGAGLMFNLGKSFDLGIESGLRYSRTDSMDYYNFAIHRNRAFDKYSLTTVGLYYKFGSKKDEHYDWINPVATIYEEIQDNKKKMQLLTGDADKDGVADYLDKEPETPEGVHVYGSGESMDTDLDGVPDYRDEEPFSDKGSPVDENGKMKDDDGDGVADGRDLEPGTKKGSLVNFQGKTIIPPGGTISIGGNGGGNIGYLPTIFFDTDKWVVKPEFYDELLGVAEALKQFPNTKLDVVGNADYRLDDGHNDMLGNNRSQAVIDVLVKKFGVDPARLIKKNNGERVPLVSGRGASFDPYNRRVNFYISGSTSTTVK